MRISDWSSDVCSSDLGYRYDGRWVPIAEDMIAHFGLKPGMRVLDVGAAKGFLVKDFMIACPGLEAFGLDVSRYALDHCEPEVVGRLKSWLNGFFCLAGARGRASRSLHGGGDRKSTRLNSSH